MNIIQRYVLREILSPTVLGLLVFTFVFLVGALFKLASKLLASGIPVPMVMELILLILPGVMAITIPMSVLVGILLGVGRLAADREILAIKAGGVSLLHLVKPLLVAALLLSGLMIWANFKAIPYLNLKLADLQVQALFKTLSGIPAGVPYKMPTEGQGSSMTVFIDSKDEQTGELKGITMYGRQRSSSSSDKEKEAGAGKQGDEGGQSGGLMGAATDEPEQELTAEEEARKEAEAKAAKQKKKEEEKKAKAAEKKMTPEEKLAERRRKDEESWNRMMTEPVNSVQVFAQTGKFEADMDNRVVYIRLGNGSIHLTDSEDVGSYDIVKFDKLSRGFVPSFDKFKLGQFEKAPEEMSIAELRAQIKVRDKGRAYSSELYKRFSVPLACVAFALIAFPLAVFVRPTGKAIAFAIAFLLILVYYGLQEYGVALVESNNPLGPVAIFLPNIIVSIIGVFLLYRAVRR